MMRAIAMLDLEGFIADVAQLLEDAVLTLAAVLDRPGERRRVRG